MAGSARTATKARSRTSKRKAVTASEDAVHAMNGASDGDVYEGDGRDQTPSNEPNGADAALAAARDASPEPAPIAPAIGTSRDSAPTDTASGQSDQGEWPIDNDTVLEVVRERKSAFIVFIDRDYQVRWLTSFATSELPEKSKDMITRARLTAALPTAHFDHEQRRAWMRMIGEALGLALSDDIENSKRTLAMAERFVQARARETARMWYVNASLLSFLVLILIGFALFNAPSVTLGGLGNVLAFDSTIGLAIVCGAVGAEFSILLRVDGLEVDPGAGRNAHRLEAAVRLLMGSFAAMIAVIAVRGDIALGFIDPGTSSGADTWLIAAIALVAGVSERFVPSILQKVETTLLDVRDDTSSVAPPDAGAKKTAST